MALFAVDALSAKEPIVVNRETLDTNGRSQQSWTESSKTKQNELSQDPTRAQHEIVSIEEEEYNLGHKVDLVVLPYLAASFVFFSIARTSLSYAAAFNVQQDLRITTTQYSWLAPAYYFGFIAFLIPNTLILQRCPLGLYLGINVFLCGFFLMLHATAKDFSQLAALRALLGAAESSSYVGLLTSNVIWYNRRQIAGKIGVWFAASGVVVGLGPLLGYGIGMIKGSLPSWKYEFLFIGALCCVWSVIAFLFLPSNPSTTASSPPRLRLCLTTACRQDWTATTNELPRWFQIKESLADPKLYVYFLLAVTQGIPDGSLYNYGQMIIGLFEYSPLISASLFIPYGLIFTISVLILPIGHSYLQRRYLHPTIYVIIASLWPAVLVGFPLRYLLPRAYHRVAQLICYYITASSYAQFPLLLSLLLNNIQGHTKRAVMLVVFFVGFAGGEIGGPFFFSQVQNGQYGPKYSLGNWSLMCSWFIEMMLLALLRRLLRMGNERMDRVVHAERLGGDGTVRTGEEITNGDRGTSFRYLY